LDLIDRVETLPPSAEPYFTSVVFDASDKHRRFNAHFNRGRKVVLAALTEGFFSVLLTECIRPEAAIRKHCSEGQLCRPCLLMTFAIAAEFELFQRTAVKSRNTVGRS